MTQQTKMIKVIKAEKFKPENVHFSGVKDGKNSSKKIYISYDYEDGRPPKPLRLRFPRMKIPFGISAFNAEDPKNKDPSDSSNDTIELSFDRQDHSLVLEKIEELNKVILDYSAKNTVEIFKKKMNRELVENQFSSAIKYSKSENSEGEMVRDDKYPPRIKTKAYKNPDTLQYTFKVQDENGVNTPISLENHKSIIHKGCEAESVLSCSSVWVISGKIGWTLRPEHLKIFPSDSGLNDYSFSDEEDEEPIDEYLGSDEPLTSMNKLSMGELDELEDSQAVKETDETLVAEKVKNVRRRKA